MWFGACKERGRKQQRTAVDSVMLDWCAQPELAGVLVELGFQLCKIAPLAMFRSNAPILKTHRHARGTRRPWRRSWRASGGGWGCRRRQTRPLRAPPAWTACASCWARLRASGGRREASGWEAQGLCLMTAEDLMAVGPSLGSACALQQSLHMPQWLLAKCAHGAQHAGLHLAS